jgi:DNA-3-methyladenine glycosylase I
VAESEAEANLVTGDDGVVRCFWGAAPPENRHYHDEEWGRPVGDDRRVFEKLCLESFQSGLSWLTILRKREAFRRAFAGFDPARVARFTNRDVERLLADAAIVRNRLKIQGTIANAQAAMRLRDDGVSLAGLLWSHEPRRRRRAPRRRADFQATTPESTALAGELRRRGFRLLGPTTVYAAMQSLGVVNDHLDRCAFRGVAETERSAFVRPDVSGIT